MCFSTFLVFFFNVCLILVGLVRRSSTCPAPVLWSPYNYPLFIPVYSHKFLLIPMESFQFFEKSQDVVTLV